MSTVALSRITYADADDLIKANIESRKHHWPWVQPFADMPAFEAWFGRTLTGPNVALIAREAASSDVVGVVNLTEIVAGPFQSAYVSYYGMVRWAGQGLMTQAVASAVTYAFEHLGLHRVEANIQPGNSASIRLVGRLGFQKEGFSRSYLCIGGEWRDHERWALLADETTDSPAKCRGA